MSKVPSAVWIVDTQKEHQAVFEARKLKRPVHAILDTNCDPDEVDYAIPGNDDAIRSVALLTRVLADAVADGLMSRSGAQTGTEATNEPMPDWERELLGNADAGPAEATAAEASAPVDASDLSVAADGPAAEEVLVPADEVPQVAAENAEAAADVVDGEAPDEDTNAAAPANAG
jgi:small subunit ribosomal protein S2